MYSNFQKATSEDEELQEVINTITEGWPSDKYLLSKRMTPYWSFLDDISCVDGLLFKSDKLVIPKSMQQEMLKKINESNRIWESINGKVKQAMFYFGLEWPHR